MPAASSNRDAQVPDLWSKLLQQKEDEKLKVSEEGAAEQEGGPAKSGKESYVLFVGDKQSGKSTLVTQFLNPKKEDKPKPTVALEYTFGRRSASTTQKDIAHIWELAGGMKVSQLIAVPITPERLPTAVVAIVVDLSKPGDAIQSLVRWTRKIKDQVDLCMKQIKTRNPLLVDSIMARARIRNNNADAEALCPVPILIFATHYDVFETQDGVSESVPATTCRKTVQNALRYIAHAYGATVLSLATSKSQLMMQYRSIMNQHVFGTEGKKVMQNDPSKPLVLPSGKDSLEGIGMPKGTRPSEFEAMGLDKRLDMWLQATVEYFPITSKDDDAGQEEGKEAEPDENIFREPIVDQMRAQKEDELMKYRREAERRLKLAGNEGKAPGVAEKKKSKKSSRPKESKAQSK